MKKLVNQICTIFVEAFRSIKPEDLSGCECIPGVIATLAYTNK